MQQQISRKIIGVLKTKSSKLSLSLSLIYEYTTLMLLMNEKQKSTNKKYLFERN